MSQRASSTETADERGDIEAVRLRSSRTSRSAAGWTDCSAAQSLTELYREGYTPAKFFWLDPRLLWQSRNDKIARWFEDPTPDERRRWIAAQRAKGVDPDLVVRRYADKPTLSFLVLGDPGEGDASQYHVLRPALARAGGTDFTYICSDVIYPAGDVNEYEDKFYWPYRQLPGPIYAIPGNHDWYDGLHGFMAHFCDADADLRPPPAPAKRRWRRWFRDLLWRKPSEPDQERMERMRDLRSERSDQPASYFAIDAGPIMLVGIDTGITAEVDGEQGEWLRRISRVDKPKLLMTGKPLVVDAEVKPLPIGASGATVNEIVDDPANRYVAVIGGDIHNYQRYPVRHPDGRVIQHVVSGAAGAYTKATHKIPKVALEGCGEEDFRCYPRRGDSLAAYSRLYDDRFAFGKGLLRVPYDQAAEIMRRRLKGDVAPTRESDRDVKVTRQARRAARFAFPLPGHSAGPFHNNFSELLDWNDPPPPLFKSFLRVDVEAGRIEITCWAATGCREHQDDPPIEDWIVGTEGADGRWEWEVKL